jgi:spectinomycin phosphotransferase
MLEPPEIPIGALIERVRARFGIPADHARFLPIGNDDAAWAFRVSTGRDAWFLKVLARPVDPASLEVPRYLAEHGVDHLVTPVPTISGRSFDRGEPFSLLLYPFVDGEPGGDIGLTTAQRIELGRLLRQIHDMPAPSNITRIIRHERFVPRDLEPVRRIAAEVRSGSFDDPLQRTLVDIWARHQREIDRIIDRTEPLGAEARVRSGDPVICHADFHAWNVLVQPSGDFVVVDWDETLLAPRERDLMFVDGGVGDLDTDGSVFYSGYGHGEIDPMVMAYYRFDWVLQELASYWRRVFQSDVGDDTRAQAVRLFASMVESGGVIAAARRADTELAH